MESCIRRHRSTRRAWTTVLVLTLLITSCGDDDGTGPGPDTTAPFVISMLPLDGASGVATSAPIRVVFSEAMDPRSHVDAVDLSTGSITATQWTDDRTLEVTHSVWPEGVPVTCTLGVGFTDVAGNALMAPSAARFWTASPDVLLLATDPVDGATDVERNAPVRMLFGHEMEIASLFAATSAEVVDGGPLAFALSKAQGNWVVLRFDALLPSEAEVRIDVSTDARTTGGVNLTQPATLRYTTGLATDLTAPVVLSLEPPSGSVLSPDQPYLRVVFDEPVDPASLQFSVVSAHLLLLLARFGIEPVPSVGGSVLTIALPHPLPAGADLGVTLSRFADLAGNAQEQDVRWDLVVAGPADFWPTSAGIERLYANFWSEGAPGEAVRFGQNLECTLTHRLDDGILRVANCPFEPDDDPTEWDDYRPMPNGIRFAGFHETSEGQPVDVDLQPDVDWIRLPWRTQTWSGTTSAHEDGEITTIDYRMEVVGRDDVLLPSELVVERMARETMLSHATMVVWKDCWKQQLEATMRQGSQVQQTVSQTFWYAPAFGLVSEFDASVRADDSWEQSQSYLVGISLPEWQPGSEPAATGTDALR